MMMYQHDYFNIKFKLKLYHSYMDGVKNEKL